MNFENKNILREKYKNIRNNLKNKNEKSDIIFEKLLNNDYIKNVETIALYKNTISEVDTTKIIDYLLSIKKIVVLPKIIDNNKMLFYKINNTKKLNKSKFGIFEPFGEQSNLILKDDIDLFIVPGICFDIKKNRVGFGKGYYDYYLENTNAKKIGICFDEQISEEIIQTNKFDVQMDFVITDKKEF